MGMRVRWGWGMGLGMRMKWDEDEGEDGMGWSHVLPTLALSPLLHPRPWGRHSESDGGDFALCGFSPGAAARGVRGGLQGRLQRVSE